MQLSVNGVRHELDVEPDTPLLWVLRDELGLTGTKYGCGIAHCGACTVHVAGRAVRSCVLPVSGVRGDVTTIEGLAAEGLAAEGLVAKDLAVEAPAVEKSPAATARDAPAPSPAAPLSPLQAVWLDAQVAQCGYCQSGQIMSAAALLAEIPEPTDEDIDRAMAGNLCRCGTYPRIREAIGRAAREGAARRGRA